MEQSKTSVNLELNRTDMNNDNRTPTPAEMSKVDVKQPAKITMHVPAFLLPKIVTSPVRSQSQADKTSSIPAFVAQAPGSQTVTPTFSAQQPFSTSNNNAPPTRIQEPQTLPVISTPSRIIEPKPQMVVVGPSDASLTGIQPLPHQPSTDNLHHQRNDRLCNVPGCGRAESPNNTLFSPQPDMARHWSDILGIDRTIIGTLAVCSLHFDQSQFINSDRGSRLIPNAIPTPMTLPRSPIMNSNLSQSHASSLSPTEACKLISTPSENQPHGVMINSVSITRIPSSEVLVKQEKPSQSSASLPVEEKSIDTTNVNHTNLLCNQNISIINAPQSDIQVVHNNNVPPPSQIQTAGNNKRRLSPEKTNGGKLRGPKCYRQAESQERSIIPLGPYARPKVPVRCNDITKDELTMLVMPSEDWSCSVYPAPDQKPGKVIYVISETLLNPDLVEIVRKSISILPNWAMKFSVMATDVSHFNLGLAASELSDIQAILDNFDAFPVCSGVFETTLSKSMPTLQGKATIFPDKKCRSLECPLLLVGGVTGTTCSQCEKLRNC